MDSGNSAEEVSEIAVDKVSLVNDDEVFKIISFRFYYHALTSLLDRM